MARVQYPKPKTALFLTWGQRPEANYDWHAVVDGPADPQPGDTIMVRPMRYGRKGLEVWKGMSASVIKVVSRTSIGLRCEYIRGAMPGDRLPATTGAMENPK